MAVNTRSTHTFKFTIRLGHGRGRTNHVVEYDLPVDTADVAREWLESFLQICGADHQPLNAKILNTELVK